MYVFYLSICVRRVPGQQLQQPLQPAQLRGGGGGAGRHQAQQAVRGGGVVRLYSADITLLHYVQSSVQTVPETRETGLQADLDLTRTPGMMLDTSNTSDLSLPSHLGGDDLEAELLPIRETKASIARKKKISEDNPKDPVHCHYPKNKNDHDHGHSHSHDH